MASRKRTAKKVDPATETAAVDTEEIKAMAVVPDSLVPGSNFSSRRAARMRARG